MKVLLLRPAAPRCAPFSTAEKRMPLGIGFLISVLRNAGHEVTFIDRYLEPSASPTGPCGTRIPYDIVGISTDTVCLEDALSLVKAFRKLRRQGRWHGSLVVGGPHASVAPESFAGLVERIVQGEGEQALIAIADGRAGEGTIRAPRIEDLDGLPRPAYDLFMKMPYDLTGTWGVESPVITMNTSRGCPFRCAFCSIKGIWGTQYTRFSAARVYEDVRYLQAEFGARTIYFREDNFTLDRNRLVDFCRLMTRGASPVGWICETRVDTLNEETVRRMARAGCRAWYVGVESGSRRVLDFLSKGESVEQFESAFRWARHNGIRTYASFMVGLPTETEKEAAESVAFARRLRADFRGFNVFVGVPGSPLYGYMLKGRHYAFRDRRGLLYGPRHDTLARRFYGKEAWEMLVPRWLSLKRLFRNRLYARSAVASARSAGRCALRGSEVPGAVRGAPPVEWRDVRFLGHRRRGDAVELYFETKRRMKRQYRVFAHAYPEDGALLPAERVAHGFINLDHEPAVPTTAWKKGMTYVDSIDLSVLAPGRYRISTGLFSEKGGMRLACPEGSSLDLGWIAVPGR